MKQTVQTVVLLVALTAVYAMQIATVDLPTPPLAPVAEQPDPVAPVEHRDDQYRDDPKAYCFFGTPDVAMPGNPSAHPCQCHPTCAVDGEGNAQRWEDHTCGLYCTKSRCLCHADEEVCQPPTAKR